MSWRVRPCARHPFHAMDVEGYRAFLGLSREDLGDEELLVTMHEWRA